MNKCFAGHNCHTDPGGLRASNGLCVSNTLVMEEIKRLPTLGKNHLKPVRLCIRLSASRDVIFDKRIIKFLAYTGNLFIKANHGIM